MSSKANDTETGRFTTPDLLWSAFPAESKYNYAYNSPLIFSDPSGLAPEKEKDREELQAFQFDWSKIYYGQIGCQEENGRMATQKFGSYWSGLIDIINDLMSKGYSYSDALPIAMTGSRTGVAKTINGTTIRYGLSGFPEGINYNYTTHIPTSKGILHVPTTVQDNAISSGETPESVMYAFVRGINDILNADSKFFDNLYGRDISVVIKHSSLIFANGKQALGKESGTITGSVITLAGDILTGHTKEPYADGAYPNQYGYKDTYHDWQNFAYIGHEFAHAIHRTIAGIDFVTYSSDIKEHYAANSENNLRSFYGAPLRYHNHGFSMGWFNKIFYLVIGKCGIII
jgi:hypothetical protein